MRLIHQLMLVSLFGLLGPIGNLQASVVLKVMAVNPSEEEREVPLKAYLPQEVKPEHILATDGLEVEYDPQQGAYYVFGAVRLVPKGSITKVVEIEDIWYIPSERLEALDKEVEGLVAKLAGTSFEEQAQLMASGISRNLEAIQEAQDVALVNPEQHISRYREHQKTLQLVDADLVSLRQLMIMATIGPSAEHLLAATQQASEGTLQTGRLSVLTTWRIIFVTLVLLGVVSVSFFLVWQRQLKLQLAKQAALTEPRLTELPPADGVPADNGQPFPAPPSRAPIKFPL